jgi:mono/diheme cytochrome c family protein
MEHARLHPLMALALLLAGFATLPAWGDESAAIQRGKAVLQAAGGCSCHTDDKHSGAFMTGGRPIKTPFGTIYSTNITPAPKTGIGTWSEADFRRAMTQGVGPDGRHYFPVFPYTTFTRMSEQDIQDLKAYLFSLPPVEQANKAPELRFPFGWRAGLAVWRWLNFRPGTFQPRADQSAEWNRGAYLTTALGHCAECHTPRNWLGGLKTTMAYAGAADGPEGELAPNITPDEATGIGAWSIADMVWFLQTGVKSDGDDVQGLMSVVIDNGYKHLPEADLRAMAVYLRSLPAVRHKVVKKDK